MEEKTFINRKDEITEIVSSLKRPGAELIIIYGRRRVGKSRLLRELSKKVNFDIFVMLEDADYKINLKKASDAAAKRFAFPQFSPKSFRDIFESVPDGSSIVLDEYSYIAGYAGEFQAVWEDIAKNKGLKIILSGSLIRVMEDLAYSLKSPLYGRATKVIKLMPLNFKYVCEWYDYKKLMDIFKIYFCVGGIPRYLELIDMPFQKSIENEFFSANGLLLREGKLLMKESFPSSSVIPKVLFSVSRGISESNKIGDDAQVKSNEIGKYLALLCDYGFIEKRFPILGGGKKDVRFYPLDRFFYFWSKFVWSYYGEIENGSNEQALANFRRNFDSYCGHEFERVLIEQGPRVIPIKFDHIGKQWGRFKGETGKNTYEIDIITCNDEKNEILFSEVKWKENVDAEALAEDLLNKSKYVEWHSGKRREIFALFARSFKKKIKYCHNKPVYCFDLDDIAAKIKNL